MKPPRAYLSQLGRKGGSTTGPTKRRGDAAHYKAMAAKAVAARVAKNKLAPPP